MLMKVVLVVLVVAWSLNTVEAASFNYPKARKVEQLDDYHGTQVADPYRWLENPDSPEAREWIEAENRITFDYLGKIPRRGQIKERMTEVTVGTTRRLVAGNGAMLWPTEARRLGDCGPAAAEGPASEAR